MEQVDVAVIGGGIIGLACARALALRGREVIVLEAEAQLGSGNSARNSEVLHSGLYYRSDSLKTQLCRHGQSLLYQYCSERGIDHRRSGKLIVATQPGQLNALRQLQQQAQANRVTSRWLDADTAQQLEPALHCHAALLVPGTGIIDSHALLQTLLGDLQAHSGWLLRRAPVIGGQLGQDSKVLELGGTQNCTLQARSIINAAGLQTTTVARMLGLPAPRQWLARGNYYRLSGAAPFQHLIYPLPADGGLGVHLTLDLAGGARFGPDVEWIEQPDWRVNTSRSASFEAAIRRYWPNLPSNALQPDYAGIRPKLHGPGQPATDFMLQGPAQHGRLGLVQLFGIESPGLTASLALAELVAETLTCNKS